MRRQLAYLALALFAVLHTRGQELVELHSYDALNSKLEGHITQILQDHNGMLWLSTWNGLYRFDGFEFTRLKPLAGDGCSMTSDRIRDAWLSPEGNIYCRTDDGNFLFNTTDYRFYDLVTDAEKAAADSAFNSPILRGKKTSVDGSTIIEFVDPQGLYWQMRHDKLYCLIPKETPVKPLEMEVPAMVSCLKRDSKGRIWMFTKSDAAVRLLDGNGNHLGYLTPSGHLTPGYASFGSTIYSFCETHDGHIWLGSKPDGLFRLTETSPGQFRVERIEELQKCAVYDLQEDRFGRLWVAQFSGHGISQNGLSCVEDLDAPKPTVTDTLAAYPVDVCRRVRRLHITNDGNVMIAATTDGLVITKLEADKNAMRFRRHSRDYKRPEGLCCNATTDVVQTADDRIFISTETDGICEITSKNLLADTLSFRRYNMDTGMLPTDMILCMTIGEGERLFIVSDYMLTMLNIYDNTYETLGHLFFRHPYKFSEARPLLLDNEEWLIGTTENAFLLPKSMAHRNNYNPPLLLTGISAGENKRMLAVENLDTLLLSPENRSVTIRFAAIDYSDPAAIRYQFRFGIRKSKWYNLGTDHSVTLHDLPPGTHLLELRSTNADGQLADNVRQLTIIVTPTFMETKLAKLFFMLLLLAIFTIATYIYLSMRRTKKRHHDNLTGYLALLENPGKEHQEIPAYMEQVLAFLGQNVTNSSADPQQMASLCNMSYEQLSKEMKHHIGLSPAELLTEARIAHACRMLDEGNYIVSEVAYRSGFKDPQVFARSFKHSKGITPLEYKKRPQ